MIWCKFWPNSIKCHDLVCDIELPPLKKCKDLNMKLKVKFLFPTSYSGANFIFISCLKVGNEKNISTRYFDAKESINQGGHFLDFHEFSCSYAGPKSNMRRLPPSKISSVASLTSKSSIVYLLMTSYVPKY